MNRAEIQRMQRKIGVDDDGFWGRVSIAGCQQYLRRLMPVPHPFPLQKDVEKFYGPPGKKNGYTPPTRKIEIPFNIYYSGKKVSALYPHERCADSLKRVFERIAIIYPTEEERNKAGISCYDGIYNPRKMRGGTSWSMHAWAIAIDINAGLNGNSTHWPSRATMPLEVMECFAIEGWLSAGAFWSRDAMHFQATQ